MIERVDGDIVIRETPVVPGPLWKNYTPPFCQACADSAGRFARNGYHTNGATITFRQIDGSEHLHVYQGR